MRGEQILKENKDARIEIRLPINIKQTLIELAKRRNTTMSKIIYSLILDEIEKENNNGKN